MQNQPESSVSSTFILTRAERLLRALMVVFACVALVLFAGVTLARINYPFELEWMEGASVDTAARLLDGEPLYTAPSSDWVSPIYGPLYYLLGAGAMQILGTGFLALRLVSWLATVGCLLILGVWAARETGSRTSGIVAAALFAATFAASGSWFDLARVDMLFVFLLLAGLYLLRYASDPARFISAGVLLGMAFLTKQPALIPIIVYSIYALFVHRGRALWFLLPLLLVIAGSTLLLEVSSGGWYSAYTLHLGDEDALIGARFLTFWSEDTQPTLIALAFAVTYIAWLFHNARGKDAAFFALLLVTMTAAAYFARLRAGGAPNVLIPMHLALMLMMAIGLGTLEKLRRSGVQPLRIGVLAACCLQFTALAYVPFEHLPDETDRRAGEAFIALLETQPGEVLVIAHGHYAEMAGRGGSRIGWSMNIVGSGGGDADFIASMTRDIARQRWSAIVVDWAVFLNEPYQAALDRYYSAEQISFETDDAFVPVTGMATRPLLLYRPRIPSPP